MNLRLRQDTDRSARRRVYEACRSAWIRSSRVVKIRLISLRSRFRRRLIRRSAKRGGAVLNWLEF
jgi:hypothetical protein